MDNKLIQWADLDLGDEEKEGSGDENRPGFLDTSRVEEDVLAQQRGDDLNCLLPCRQLTEQEIRVADGVMERTDVDTVLFTNYNIPIQVKHLHRLAQPGTWGRENDELYYLNDELVNYWFQMLNTKLNERKFAHCSGKKAVCLLNTFFLRTLEDRMEECRAKKSRGGQDLSSQEMITSKASKAVPCSLLIIT